MVRHLWVKFLFLLLGVAAVALSGTLVLRSLMLGDFEAYIEGEAEDKIYLIQADLEGAYERQNGWQADLQGQDAIRALFSGFEMRLLDREGKLVVATEQALGAASPLVKKRLDALAPFHADQEPEGFVPYPLFLAGSEIGTLEVRELRPVRKNLFLGRSNRFMALSILIVGLVSILLSILFSRRLTRPVKELALAAAAISRGELKRRVTFTASDELGGLADSFNHMAGVLETQEMLRKKLIADVAHELRTPLAVMRGELEGMMDGLIPNDPERLQSLYEETGRLRNMVSAIEELNRAEASRLSLQKAWIALTPFLSGITERFRIAFQEKGVVLELICRDDDRLFADPERLSQIVLNLLSNALKATESGGKVALRAVSSDDGWSIIVEDTGSGIAEEELPHLFERFYRGKGGGLGIGLTIVKELAEAHGASVEAKNRPEKGAAFAVHFPGGGLHNVS